MVSSEIADENEMTLIDSRTFRSSSSIPISANLSIVSIHAAYQSENKAGAVGLVISVRKG